MVEMLFHFTWCLFVAPGELSHGDFASTFVYLLLLPSLTWYE